MPFPDMTVVFQQSQHRKGVHEVPAFFYYWFHQRVQEADEVNKECGAEVKRFLHDTWSAYNKGVAELTLCPKLVLILLV